MELGSKSKYKATMGLKVIRANGKVEQYKFISGYGLTWNDRISNLRNSISARINSLIEKARRSVKIW